MYTRDTSTVKNKFELDFEELGGIQENQTAAFIGYGAHSSVFSGKYKSNPVAIKKLRKNNKNHDPSEENPILQLLHETIANEKIMNAHIVHFYGYALHQSDEYLVFALMFCTLDKWLVDKNNCLSLNYRLMGNIAEALRFIHRFVVHCDLKPDNLYIEKSGFHTYARIGDFSFSYRINGAYRHSKRVGSPLYSAPELLREEVLNSEKTDIYSLGLILYYVATMTEAYNNHFEPLKFIMAVGFSNEHVAENPKAERDSPKLMAMTRWCTGAPDARPTSAQLASEFATSRNALSKNLSLFTKEHLAHQAVEAAAARQKTRALLPGCMK